MQTDQQESFQSAAKEIDRIITDTRSADSFWDGVSSLLDRFSDTVSYEEVLSIVSNRIINAKSSMIHSYYSYLKSYLTTLFIVHNNCSDYLDGIVYSVAFLAHHCVELFIKYLKLNADVFMIAIDLDPLDAMTPQSIHSLGVSTHDIIKHFDDTDIVLWYSLLPTECKKDREKIINLYHSLCSTLSMDNLSETTRYPSSKKSYVSHEINDEETVQAVLDIAFEIASTIAHTLSKYSNMDTQRKMIAEIIRRKGEQHG